jgi:hypothetical protein
MPSTRRGPSIRHVAIALVLVGFVVLAHPVYLFEKHGQAPRYLEVSEIEGASASEAVAYDDLPPDARRALDDAVRGGSATLWTGEDDAAIDALRDARLVERDGTYYRSEIRYVGGIIWGYATSIRILLTALGSVALVVGGLAARRDSLRPLTPGSALAVPAVSAVAILATNLYDVYLSAASESYWMAAEGFGGVALVAIPFTVAVRQGDGRSAGLAVGLGLVASVVLLVGLGASAVFGAIVLVPTLVASLVLGALLADPEPA